MGGRIVNDLYVIRRLVEELWGFGECWGGTKQKQPRNCKRGCYRSDNWSQTHAEVRESGLELRQIRRGQLLRQLLRTVRRDQVLEGLLIHQAGEGSLLGEGDECILSHEV